MVVNITFESKVKVKIDMIPGRLALNANSSCVLTVRPRIKDLDYRYNLGDKVQGLQMSYYAVFIC